MPASFIFSESNGVGETPTTATNLNFGSNDSPNLNVTTYPITRNTNSFEKYLRAYFSGTYTEISSLKFWKSLGAYGAGETIKAATNKTYVQPVATTSTVATSDVPIVVGSALTLQSAEGAATITKGSGVSGYSKYLVLQMQTTNSTPAGAVAQKTFVLQYDEV